MLVSFISLVLVSAIHKVMKEKGLPIWRNTPQSTARESACAPYVSVYCVKKVTERTAPPGGRRLLSPLSAASSHEEAAGPSVSRTTKVTTRYSSSCRISSTAFTLTNGTSLSAMM